MRSVVDRNVVVRLMTVLTFDYRDIENLRKIEFYIDACDRSVVFWYRLFLV